MNIRNAFLLAAGHIERNPREFDFTIFEMPPARGTPGCALGWVGLFSGMKFVTPRHGGWVGVSSEIAGQLLGLTASDFYRRMDDFSPNWRRKAGECAAALRTYADKYHPAEKPERNFARELMANLPAERIPDEVTP